MEAVAAAEGQGCCCYCGTRLALGELVVGADGERGAASGYHDLSTYIQTINIATDALSPRQEVGSRKGI